MDQATCSKILPNGQRIPGGCGQSTIDARVVVNDLMGMGLDLRGGGIDDDVSIKDAAILTYGWGACQIRFEPDMVKKIIFATSEQMDDIDEQLFGLEYIFTLNESSSHSSPVGNLSTRLACFRPRSWLNSFRQFFGHRKEGSKVNKSDDEDKFWRILRNKLVLNRHGSNSTQEYDIAKIYVALKFQKVREMPEEVANVGLLRNVKLQWKKLTRQRQTPL